MFKRLFWLGLGATLGVGTSWWITRAVRLKLEQLLPANMRDSVATKARTVGGGVRAALTDGRHAMHEREDQLRARLEARYPPPTG
jgi:hypothetical protein